MAVGQAMCTGGDHPTNAQGVTLCHRCATELEADLRDAPFVWKDIQTTGARLDVGAASVGSSGHKAPRPAANLDALDKAQTLRVILGGWASQLPQLHPANDPVKTALWLITQMPEIRKQPWAGDLKQELREALNACRWATDRAADRISLGECSTECPGIMTAIVGGRVAKCRLCGAVDNVRARQQWIIAEAWHVATFLPNVVRALSGAGHAKVDIGKADVWVHRGKLEPVACDVATRRSLYTAADVLATYLATPTGRKEVAPRKQVALAS